MPRKREEDGEMELEATKALLNIIMLYYNFFIPAFPDGRTPAEAASMEVPEWLKPLIQQYKEPLDKQAVQEFTGDRIARLTVEIMSEIQKNGAPTRRCEAILKIVEASIQALSEGAFLPSSEPPQREEEVTPQSLKDVKFVIPFTTVYRVSNVKKCRRKIRQHMEQEHDFDSSGRRIEIHKDAPQKGAEAFLVLSYDKSGIGTKLGSMGLIPHQNGLLIHSLSAARHNALRGFLKKLLGNNITLLSEERNLELPSEQAFGERR